MAAAVAVRLANNIVGDSPRVEGILPHISSETFTKEIMDAKDVETSSSYILASQSQFSSDVDRWIRGNTSMASTGVQNSRAQLVQRSTAAMAPSFDSSPIWYLLAMMLPLFRMHPDGVINWRCDPSAFLNTAEVVLAHITYICELIRNHIRRLAQEQVARDLFAKAMDVVLVVYAVGFLILSMYQASIIG